MIKEALKIKCNDLIKVRNINFNPFDLKTLSRCALSLNAEFLAKTSPVKPPPALNVSHS